MLTLCYGCGLRAGEVCRLKAGDIDSELNIIRIVQAKGRKDRHVMLPPEVLDLLRQWWKARPTRYDAGVPLKERWLFPDASAASRSPPASYRACSMRQPKPQASSKRVTLHSLRHSFATHLFEQGTDIRLIQAVLGHAHFDTTARYTRVATGRIAIIASPLSRKRKPPKKNGKAA